MNYYFHVLTIQLHQKNQTYLIKVVFPVKGPNLISSNGGWKPSICKASSWV